MPVQPGKLDKLHQRLQRIVSHENLDLHRTLIQQTSSQLGIDLLDCAAALLYLNQPHLLPNANVAITVSTPAPKAPTTQRNVRYRLDVGNHHQVSQEALLAVLIEESGVDKKRIARIDMRDTYTLVDLPDGMPADIFQLLTEATVGEHKLNIKRVKPNRRR